jgi:ArsR family transcriptional regulator
MISNKTFQALASTTRRSILAYLEHQPLTAGDIANKFEMSKPAISKHLNILENAALISGEKKGQFIHYSLVKDNLVNTLTSYLQLFCPTSRKLKKAAKDGN